MKKIIFLIVAFFSLMINVNATNNTKTEGIDTIFIGDSYCRGVKYDNTNNDQGRGWAQKTVDKLTLDYYYISCKGGTGFVREVDGEKFIDLLNNTDSKLENDKVKLVVVAGGWNDAVVNGISSTQMINAINSFVTRAKQLYPNAQIVLSMISWTSSDEALDVERKNTLTTIIEPSYEQAANNNNVLYISNGKSVMVNHPEYFATDQLHPLEVGNDAIGEMVANYIKANSMHVKYTDDNTSYDYIVGKGGKFKTRTREGYDFNGWKTSENGNVIYQGNSNITDTIIKNSGSVMLYPDYSAKYYPISKGEDDNIKITIEDEETAYQAGSTIKYSVSVKDGYKINKVNVTYGDNKKVENTFENGKGSFTMPFASASIGIEYSKIESDKVVTTQPTTPSSNQPTTSTEQKKNELENPNTGIKKPGIIFAIIIIISYAAYMLVSNKKLLKK